jgi:hypothetical protein
MYSADHNQSKRPRTTDLLELGLNSKNLNIIPTLLAKIEENLPTIMEPSMVSLQDNAPTHTAHVVQNWLVEWAEENGVGLVDWPPYFPASEMYGNYLNRVSVRSIPNCQICRRIKPL